MSIYFTKLQFSLKLLTDVNLPVYLGSTLRGGLGYVFKRTVCFSPDRYCEGCLLKAKCAYSYCFETLAGQEMSLSYDSSNYPHPFIIEPPPEFQNSSRGEKHLTFNLVLIGKGIDYLPYFVFVFDELGKSGIGREKGKYILEKVESLSSSHHTQDELIYNSKGKFLSDSYEIKTFTDIINQASRYTARTLTINFLTPTRIKYQGGFGRNIDFHVFIKNLLRRFSLLSEMHCESKLNLHYAEIIEKAKKVQTIGSNLKWQDWERYSSRQKAKLKLGGFTGYITFKGDLTEFMPLIKMGEYLHIGKGTSFGLGKYEMVAQDKE